MNKANEINQELMSKIQTVSRRVSFLAINLANTRKQAGMSQQEAAARLGIKRTRLGHWETGVAAPNLEMLVRICDLYGYKDVYKLLTEVI